MPVVGRDACDGAVALDIVANTSERRACRARRGVVSRYYAGVREDVPLRGADSDHGHASRRVGGACARVRRGRREERVDVGPLNGGAGVVLNPSLPVGAVARRGALLPAGDDARGPRGVALLIGPCGRHGGDGARSVEPGGRADEGEHVGHGAGRVGADVRRGDGDGAGARGDRHGDGVDRVERAVAVGHAVRHARGERVRGIDACGDRDGVPRPHAGAAGDTVHAAVARDGLVAGLVGEDVPRDALGLRLEALQHHRERRGPQVRVGAGGDQQPLPRGGVLLRPEGKQGVADGVAGAAGVAHVSCQAPRVSVPVVCRVESSTSKKSTA